jgi:hypothetical protein
MRRMFVRQTIAGPYPAWYGSCFPLWILRRRLHLRGCLSLLLHVDLGLVDFVFDPLRKGKGREGKDNSRVTLGCKVVIKVASCTR